MTNFKKRLGIISKLAEQKPGLGKTAMMKYIFLLQSVYKLPLGYEFDIYTYGPYSSEVMEDIDLARSFEVISIKDINYPMGQSGFEINPSRNGREAITEVEEFIVGYNDVINQVIEKFGDMKAKELELITTIVYMYQTYLKNNISITIDNISQNVKDIKPHFHIEEIKNQYEALDNLGVLHS